MGRGLPRGTRCSQAAGDTLNLTRGPSQRLSPRRGSPVTRAVAAAREPSGTSAHSGSRGRRRSEATRRVLQPVCPPRARLAEGTLLGPSQCLRAEGPGQAQRSGDPAPGGQDLRLSSPNVPSSLRRAAQLRGEDRDRGRKGGPCRHQRSRTHQ